MYESVFTKHPGMNILVTGGAGFIGSHTVVSLKEAGFNPIIVDNFSNSEKSVMAGLKKILGSEVPCYAIDCNNYAELRKVVRDEKIEGVIHFAAFKAVGESMREPLCLLYTSPSPRDRTRSRMPSSA